MKNALAFPAIMSVLRKYEVILASVLVISAIGVSSWLFLIPNFMQVGKILSQGEKLSKRLVDLEKKENLLSEIDYSFFKDNFPKVISVLPENKNFVSLFYTLDNLEAQTGVSVIRAEFQLGILSGASKKLEKAKGSSAFMMPITIEILGTPLQVQDFFEATKNLSGRLINIDDIHLNFKKDDLIQVTLNGNAYFYPLPTAIASLDSPLVKLTDREKEVLEKISQKAMLATRETEFENVEVGKKNLFQ